jgi:hypothetical protein
MPAFSELTMAQQNYYMAFHAPVVNNVPQHPNNNDLIPFAYMITPTEGQLNAVRDTGDQLVRTINYRLNERQRNSLLEYLEDL